MPTHTGLDHLRDQWDRVSRRDDRSLAERSVAYVAPGESFADSGRRALDVLLDVCPADQNKSILEFGCGLGRVTQHLDSRFGRVFAVDIAPGMFDAVKSMVDAGVLRKTIVVLSDGQSLGLTRPVSHPRVESIQPVDIVYSDSVLLHNRKVDVFGFWPSVLRLLKPGGRACFQLPCYDVGREPLDWTDVGAWTPSEIQMLAELADCDIEKIWRNPGEFSFAAVGPNHHCLHVFRKR